MPVLDKKDRGPGYSSLFKPGFIGKLNIKNRLIMAAMGNTLADNNGNITEAMLEHYRARSAGGAGMVIVQFASTSREDILPNNLGIYDDSFIPGLSKLVQVIHDRGARACLQLMHPGMLLLLLKSLPPGMTIKVPYITPRMGKDRPYQEINAEYIEKCLLDFASAAGRAKEAGADAVELHACHGCLLSTFLSPAVNRRTDLYGGSIENRARFVSRAVEKIKEKVGTEFPLIVRINGCDDVEGGVTPSEVVSQAEILKNSGADAISISSGLEYWTTLMAPSYLTPEGAVIPIAEGVKKAVNLPVIAAGKISPDLAEITVENGRADFIALGRPLLAEPALPNKLQSGNKEEIAGCLYCNNCLRSSWRSCTVNPFLYRESGTLSPSVSPKKILVIGGGLAGMQAAVLCKKRGHDVSLFEKEPELGGQWKIASQLPGKEGYAAAITYLKHSLEKLQVPVTLNNEVTREQVAAIKPEIAIIAAGAVPQNLELPGASGNNYIQANDVIRGKVAVEGKIVVLGASVLAVETAVFLAEKGKAVVLVSHSGLGGRKGADDLITFRGLIRRLVQLRIPLYLNAAVIELNAGSLVIGLGGETVSLPCDRLITAIGVRPVDKLSEELKGIVPDIYLIGDCLQPGSAAQATFSAARLALKL
jgi:2,4-dienoyl-CoA reductase (NADPH2)